MVAPIQTNYSNRKGIYKDLYREIDTENKKKEASQVRKPKKGIYREMYKQIEFKNNEKKNEPNSLYALVVKKTIQNILSKISYACAAATGGIKMILVAFVMAKKPINSYIEDTIPTYIDEELNQGIYYNDR